MKIDLNEIWEFMDMAPQPRTADRGDHWLYELVAGGVVVKNLKSQDITNLKKEENYDTELLPSIFTFREILWQPNVYTKPSQCIPQLNILKVFCEDYVSELKNSQNGDVWPYFGLLNGLGHYCGQALEGVTSVKKEGDIHLEHILGNLRKNAFPIIKFFIFHPMNRKDYQRDALNRLNYAVKIMLTQYNNKYFDLQDPYWNVSVGKPDKKIATEQKKEELPNSTKENPVAKATPAPPTKPQADKPKQKAETHVVSSDILDHELEEL